MKKDRKPKVCSICKGSGKFSEYFYSFGVGRIDTTTKCPKCKGKGIIYK